VWRFVTLLKGNKSAKTLQMSRETLINKKNQVNQRQKRKKQAPPTLKKKKKKKATPNQRRKNFLIKFSNSYKIN